jgi:membrane associated rhomboid family serine protease
MRRHLRHWGAAWVLVLLFLGSWVGQFFAQLVEFRNEQLTHSQSFTWADFLPTFLSATLENWQSEWFQLIFQAILLMGAKHWIFKVEADDTERIEGKIDTLLSSMNIEHEPRPAKWPDKPRS